jgi:GxxExxY protein
MDVNQLSNVVIGAAIDVHKTLGPGLLESAYETCLSYELGLRKIRCQRQLKLPVEYKDVLLDCGYRLDLLIEDKIVLELKSVEKILPIHDAQLLTYMKLGGWQLGIIFNFNVPLLRNGIKRKVLNFEEK